MKLKFYKYHGAGNDFIMIDNREKHFPTRSTLIKHLCDRRFGIGGDGLILLQKETSADFRMVYFNADGNESTMCGNGGRCIVHFANYLGIIGEKTTFTAIDGLHEAEIVNDLVNLKMIDVARIKPIKNDFWLDTGSPHYVQFVQSLDEFNVVDAGSKIRNNDTFKKDGTNVNFVETVANGHIKIRTYERGVEDETLACGTGVTAAAIVYGSKNACNHIKVDAVGGNLEVKFDVSDDEFTNIWLKGPAEMVFSGEISV